jgi:hypothetical protein
VLCVGVGFGVLCRHVVLYCALAPQPTDYCLALACVHCCADLSCVQHGQDTHAPPLDRDFENNHVNFAVLFLKTTLSRQGFLYGAELPAAYANLDDIAYTTPEVTTFHTLVWLLARYEALEHEDTEAELVALLTAMQESRAQDPLLNTLDIDYEYILRQCRLYQRRRYPRVTCCVCCAICPKCIITAMCPSGMLYAAVRYLSAVQLTTVRLTRSEVFVALYSCG